MIREINIREFVESDQETVAAFIVSIFKELNWPMEDADGLDDIAKFFGLPKGIFLVVVDFRWKIVGCVGVKSLDEGVGLIKRFYINLEFRGKGIAQQLMSKLEAEAKNKGYRILVLDVEKDDPRAQRFYEKRGYKYYSPTPNDHWKESFMTNELKYMRKKI